MEYKDKESWSKKAKIYDRNYLMTAEHAYWKETIAFAERCSWKAGSFLAGKMQENDFQEWERVCAVCVNGKVAGFSTFTERDELSERYDFTPFIGFVFVWELLNHLDKLHTTELGVVRIKRNLSLDTDDIVEWCKDNISSAHAIITRRGKNWYVTVDDIVITVNAHSCTIITAHRKKG